MSDTIIKGLVVTIRGAELITMAEAQVQDAKERIDKLKVALVRVDDMDPRDREIAGFKTRGGDMKDEVKNKIETQQERARFFEFYATHVEAEAMYRLETGQLAVFGYKPPGRY